MIPARESLLLHPWYMESRRLNQPHSVMKSDSCSLGRGVKAQPDDVSGTWIPEDGRFVSVGADVASIRFAGTKSSGRFGLAFDNFATCASAPTTLNERKELPATFATLQQNYPNPFTQSTAIGYQLLETADVNLEVYSMLGQKLTTLTHEPYVYAFTRIGFFPPCHSARSDERDAHLLMK